MPVRVKGSNGVRQCERKLKVIQVDPDGIELAGASPLSRGLTKTRRSVGWRPNKCYRRVTEPTPFAYVLYSTFFLPTLSCSNYSGFEVQAELSYNLVFGKRSWENSHSTSLDSCTIPTPSPRLLSRGPALRKDCDIDVALKRCNVQKRKATVLSSRRFGLLSCLWPQ